MSDSSLLLIVVAIVGFAAIVVAGAVSALKPFNAIKESAALALEIARAYPWLAVSAVAFYAVQQFAPSLVVGASSNLFVALALIILLQAGSVYALAHVAYRLHRGLILSEWKQGLSWGRKERRMALYVLGGWALISLLSQSPALLRISPAAAILVSVALSGIVLLAKIVLALIGPAASLDDPAPLRRSIASAVREPAGVFAVVAMAQAMLTIVALGFGLLNAWASEAGAAAYAVEALAVVAAAYVFVVSELALVITLTRAWEDVYEPQTRYASHNLNWL